MEGQQYLLNKDTTISDNLSAIQQKFESDFTGDLRAHDIESKKCISAYACKDCWIKIIQRKDEYQHKICSIGTYFIVWPVGKIFTGHNFREFHVSMQ